MNANTPYANKLQYALLDAGKAVEKVQHEMTPTGEELDVLYQRFKEAEKGDNMQKKIKAAKAFTTAILKWQIETL